MKVILLENIQKLGSIGEIINVKRGIVPINVEAIKLST